MKWPRASGYKTVKCGKYFHSVPKFVIEEAVFLKLFEVFGDKKKIEEAQKLAMVDTGDEKELKKQIGEWVEQKKKADAIIDKYMDEFEKPSAIPGKVRERIEQWETEKQRCQNKIEELENQLREYPSLGERIAFAAKAQKEVGKLLKKYKSPEHYKSMKIRRIKRGLPSETWMPSVVYLFDAIVKDIKVKPEGKNDWTFEIFGDFPLEEKYWPLNGKAYGKDTVFSAVREHEWRS